MQDPFRVDGSGDVRRRAWVVTPVAVVIWAEVALRLPGHQATNDPLPVVASIWSPSLRTRVTPVTPWSTWPSTNV